jgi:hypothetical protein
MDTQQRFLNLYHSHIPGKNLREQNAFVADSLGVCRISVNRWRYGARDIPAKKLELLILLCEKAGTKTSQGIAHARRRKSAVSSPG